MRPLEMHRSGACLCPRRGQRPRLLGMSLLNCQGEAHWSDGEAIGQPERLIPKRRRGISRARSSRRGWSSPPAPSSLTRRDARSHREAFRLGLQRDRNKKLRNRTSLTKTARTNREDKAGRHWRSQGTVLNGPSMGSLGKRVADPYQR